MYLCMQCVLDYAFINRTNIVGFIGAVTEPSNLCIITQYCARGSLADLLLDDKIWMNFKVKVKFALEAAMGMLYLHKSNPVILHRDLKSDNLLVTNDWTIKGKSRERRRGARRRISWRSRGG
jgi:serine/threonine protein kinase